MPTLKEIKGRIASVKSTLKITSAMKLVSSAKLRKAQSAIEAMRPYEAQLQQMLSRVAGPVAPVASAIEAEKEDAFEGFAFTDDAPILEAKRVIVAIASNSSLCGGFNANAIAKVRSVRQAGDVVFSIGRKMADAMRKDGFPSPKDYTALAEHPAYGPVAELFEELAKEVAEGKVTEVLLVYNHFVSSARQVPVVEKLLPVPPGEGSLPEMSLRDPVRANISGREPSPTENPDVILEPGREALVKALLPKTLKLKLYAALLDSVASEHAARTIAMQTATDNGENLLSELTLQYNKGRQQKITAEILDLAGGQSAD